MEIKVKTGDLLREPSDLAILAACEETRLTAELTGLFEAGDFRGRADQTLLLYPRTGQGPRRLLLTGLGQQDALDVAKVRQASAAALRKAREMQVAVSRLASWTICRSIAGPLPRPLPRGWSWVHTSSLATAPA